MPITEEVDPFDGQIEEQATVADLAIPFGTIFLDGQPFPVLNGELGVQELGVFDARFVIGDPQNDSDKFFSLWEQSDWRGGGQIDHINTSSETGRYRHATADMMHPGIITLPLKTRSYTIASPQGNATPIGDYPVDSTVVFWAAFGTDLCYWNEGSTEFTPADDLSAAAANKGVEFDDLLWIPLGSSGYDVWDGVAIVNHTDVHPVAFAEWDYKLVALGVDGQISTWDGDAWESPSMMKIRGRRTMRNLVSWWTPERQRALFIVTNKDVWVCDFLVPTIYRTGLIFPKHPDFGLGSAAWQDDSMYVSVGMGCHQFALGGVISPMGLDRDAGMPSDLRGAIVDMEPEYNGLLALVKGIGTIAIGDDTTLGPVMEETMLADSSLVVPTSSSLARSTLQRWTGQGWHTVWESTGATGDPSRVMVSETDDEAGYRLWWGYGTSMYTQPLRRSQYNPKQGAELGIDEFEDTAYIYTGRFDAGMAIYQKAISHLKSRLDPSSEGTVEIYYRTDDETTDYTLLATIDGTGLKSRGFDPDGDGWYEGLASHWVEFKYVLSTTDSAKTPIINFFTMAFVKVPLQTRSWRFVVPIEFDEQWRMRGPDEIKTHLSELTSTTRYLPFKPGGDTTGEVFRVRVASVSGQDMTGQVLHGSRQVNLIEMEVPDDE